MEKKNICVITGARSEYGIFRLILNKILFESTIKTSFKTSKVHFSITVGLQTYRYGKLRF